MKVPNLENAVVKSYGSTPPEPRILNARYNDN